MERSDKWQSESTRRKMLSFREGMRTHRDPGLREESWLFSDKIKVRVRWKRDTDLYEERRSMWAI